MKNLKWYSVLVLIVPAVLIAGCQNGEVAKHACSMKKASPRFGPYPQIDRSRIYGMGYPAMLRTEYGDFNLDQAKKGLELMHAMGVKSWRSWMHTRLLLEDPTTPRPDNVAMARELIRLAHQYDMEVVAMNHDWFNGVEELDAQSADIDDVSIPRRDLTDGSDYLKVLREHIDKIEQEARRFQFDHVLVDSSQSIGSTLREFLARRSARLKGTA